MADVIYPPRDAKTISSGSKTRTIQLGPDNYINRLATFCEERSNSERFNELVGSHLALVGDRLDAFFKAAQKGSHANVSREEASRTVIYTYLLIGDILELHEGTEKIGKEDRLTNKPARPDYRRFGDVPDFTISAFTRSWRKL